MNTFLYKDKKILFLFLITAPLSAFASVIFALSLGPILTAATQRDIVLLKNAGLVCVITAVMDMVLGLALKKSNEKLVATASGALRESMAEGVLRQSVFSFQKENTARYLALFHNDAERVEEFWFRNICILYRVIWSFTLSAIAIIRYSSWLIVFLLLIGILSIRIPALFEKKLSEKQEEQTSCANQHMASIKDLVSGFWVIKNHGIEEKMEGQYQEVNRKFTESVYQMRFFPFQIAWISMSFTTAAFIGIIIISSLLVIKGRMGIGIVLSLSQLVGGILAPMEEIPQCLSQMKSVKETGKQLLKFSTGSTGKEAVIKKASEWSKLAFSNIQFSYEEKGKRILEQVSLYMEKGKKYALIGKSGSGKSTLAKVIAGIYPAEYSLFLDGQVCAREELADRISYMNQDVFLFHDTIYQNIALYQEVDRKEVTGMLEKMGFQNCEALLDISVGENGAALSGGERQRIGLARELIHKKEILILDEFTSSLDAATAAAVEEMVMKLQDTTCLFITHRTESEMLKYCDKIYRLENGHMIP